MRKHTAMMMKHKLFVTPARLMLIAALTTTLSACIWVDDTDDLVQFVTDVQAKPKGRIEPLPTFEPYHSFVYQGASLRDPFVPLVKVAAVPFDIKAGDGNGLEPDLKRPKGYLEQFSLDDLAMVGTIGKVDEPGFWALIRDENDEIHRIATGDHMGLDFGEVIAVTEQQVDVLEIISDGRGGWMQRSRVVELTEQ